jgi:hypothetical protein
MSQTKNKLALELSPAELADFCAALADVPHGELVSKIMAMAEERGIRIGKTSAYGFKNGELMPWLKRLQMRREKSEQLQEFGSLEGGISFADAAASAAGEMCFDFVTDIDGQLDLTTKEGQATFDTLTRGIQRIRSGDRALIKQLQDQIDETKADLKNPQLTEEQRAARMRSRFGV